MDVDISTYYFTAPFPPLFLAGRLLALPRAAPPRAVLPLPFRPNRTDRTASLIRSLPRMVPIGDDLIVRTGCDAEESQTAVRRPVVALLC